MQQTVGGELDTAEQLYLSASSFAQDLDPKALSGAEAKKLLELASRTKSVMAVIEAFALVRIDETNAYKASGHRSAADYGAAKTGTTAEAAKRAMRTSKKAERLRNTDEARRRGDLSDRQSDEITDAAYENPAAEDDLLDSAKNDDFGTLRDKARKAKASADRDAAARARRLHAQRSLRHWSDREGAAHSHLRTTPDAAARFQAALEPYRRAVFEAARKQGRRESPDAYAADALDALIDALHNGTGTPPQPDAAPEPTPEPNERPRPTAPPADQPAPTPDPDPAPPPDEPTLFDQPDHDNERGATASGDDSPPADQPAAGNDTRPSAADAESTANNTANSPSEAGSAGSDPPSNTSSGQPPPKKARSSPLTTAHLFVDVAALQRGLIKPGETCEIKGIGPIDLATAQAMLGDATLKLLIRDGHDIRTVVHLGRSVTARQRSALEARDPCCVIPGCGHCFNLEIDHRTGWTITHTTSLDDLARLCRYHHYLKTHCGYYYTGGPGTWQWHAPDGTIATAA